MKTDDFCVCDISNLMWSVGSLVFDLVSVIIPEDMREIQGPKIPRSD